MVLTTFSRIADGVMEVSLSGRASPIRATANHPFYSLSAGEWRQAGELQAGERLLTRSGETEVTGVASGSGALPVFNLSVEVDHCYWVGDQKVLVHNSCPKTLSPSEINFSQTTVNREFDTPRGKIGFDKALKNGPSQVADFPAITVRKVDGQYVVVDGNSRLSIARQTGAEKINVNIKSDYESAVDLNRRTSRNGLPRSGTSKLPIPR